MESFSKNYFGKIIFRKKIAVFFLMFIKCFWKNFQKRNNQKQFLNSLENKLWKRFKLSNFFKAEDFENFGVLEAKYFGDIENLKFKNIQF